MYSLFGMFCKEQSLLPCCSCSWVAEVQVEIRRPVAPGATWQHDATGAGGSAIWRQEGTWQREATGAGGTGNVEATGPGNTWELGCNMAHPVGNYIRDNNDRILTVFVHRNGNGNHMGNMNGRYMIPVVILKNRSDRNSNKYCSGPLPSVASRRLP